MNRPNPLAFPRASGNLKVFVTGFDFCLCCGVGSFGYFDFMGKRKGAGRPPIRTAEYWREYYTRKQREWRAAHPRIKTKAKTKTTAQSTKIARKSREQSTGK